MKKNSLFLALASVLLFSACDKNDTEPNNNTSTYFMKAKIDGTMYEGTSFSANMVNNTASFSSMINYKGQSMGLVASQTEYSGPKTYKDSILTIMTLGGGAEGPYSHWQDMEPVTIKITSDNGTEVKAEFSGKMRHFDDTTVILNVTEGSLYMKWLGK